MSTLLPNGMIPAGQRRGVRGQDATAKDSDRKYHALFVRQEKWEQYQPKTFREMKEGFL